MTLRTKFQPFYGYNSVEKRTLLEAATIAVDTNVLLDLYRVPPITSQKLLSVLDDRKAQLWMPHQVGLEFSRRRSVVLVEQLNKFQKTRDAVTKGLSSLRDSIRELDLERRHTAIDPTEFLEELANVEKQFLERMKAAEADHRSPGNDDLYEHVSSLFGEKLGDPFSPERMAEIRTEALVRFEKEIPPGYKDAGKEDNFEFAGVSYTDDIGDYLVWSQLIDYANQQPDSSMIFVTNDTKEDWFEKKSGKVSGPRFELVDEFYQRTGSKIWITTSPQFVEAVGEFSGTDQGTLPDELRQAIRERVQYINHRRSSSFGQQEIAVILDYVGEQATGGIDDIVEEFYPYDYLVRGPSGICGVVIKRVHSTKQLHNVSLKIEGFLAGASSNRQTENIWYIIVHSDPAVFVTAENIIEDNQHRLPPDSRIVEMLIVEKDEVPVIIHVR